MIRRMMLFVLFLAIVVSFGAAQEISQRKDIAIFALNYYGAPPTTDTGGSVELKANAKTGEVSLKLQGSGSQETDRVFQQALGSIDSQIRQVFSGLNRFNVIGLPQRLTDGDVQAFIDTIRQFNETNAEIPEEVRFGEVAFTEADFNRLVGAFYVVIPSVIRYDQFLDEDANFNTDIVTSFTIIDVQNYQTIDAFQIETSGIDEVASRSMANAVDAIPFDLDFKVRSIEEFRLRTAIIEIAGPDVFIQLGNDLGVMVGEEYQVLRFVDRAGFQSERPIALLEIKEIDQQYSVARVVYAEQPLVVGDSVVELPRIGITIEPFLDISILNFVSQTEPGPLVFGLRTAITRGFYGFRPAATIDLMSLASETSLFASLALGGEFNLSLGRLRPHLAFDVAPVFKIDNIIDLLTSEESDADDAIVSEASSLSHLRIGAKARVAYLFGDSFEVFLEAGALYGIPLSEVSAFGGITIGAGVTFK